MASFTSIALTIALAGGGMSQSFPSIGYTDYGSLVYEIRSVNDGRGIGGSPAYCTVPGSDLVLVLYTVTNRGEVIRSGASVPRLVLLGPSGDVLRPDRRLSDALSRKVLPYLALPRGVLEPGQTVVLADIFVTRRLAVRDRPWQFRADAEIVNVVNLPQAKRADPPEC